MSGAGNLPPADAGTRPRRGQAGVRSMSAGTQGRASRWPSRCSGRSKRSAVCASGTQWTSKGANEHRGKKIGAPARPARLRFEAHHRKCGSRPSSPPTSPARSPIWGICRRGASNANPAKSLAPKSGPIARGAAARHSEGGVSSRLKLHSEVLLWVKGWPIYWSKRCKQQA
jgi:hypothetical protein